MRRLLAPVLAVSLAVTLTACQAILDAEVDVLAAQAPAVNVARRCAQCGWIESKRKLAPSATDPDAPQSYEYTVRMRDGSSSVFHEALPVSWRLRERLTLIPGVDPLN